MGIDRSISTRAREALRRIERLEAERRRVQRSLARCTPGSPYARELDEQLAELDVRIEHWGAIVVRAEAEGFRVWTRADFRRGDFVRYRGDWYEVLRANPKSLTVPHGRGTWTVPYTDVSGRRSGVDQGAGDAA
ncbi:hypothetical protein [Streptomyces sp. NRRL S-455]|uniref:hypothetical protein n=1 Tax=Streptomyces sp. NRRL S-455 TaxID=1463908 RepID=UPI0004C1F9FE|nr:hypothetical protein [Streptomyces sp. NRRL S-455]